MRNLVIGVAGLTLVATLATVILWLVGQQIAAAVIGSCTFFLWLALLVTVVAVVVSWWSASLMQRGAELALRSQESDDRRDAIQIKAVADLAKVLMRQTQSQYPALPLPSQQGEWLPELAEFNVVEGECHD
jgi:heme exporter protein D